MFKENKFIENTLDTGIGKIISVNPVLESVIGVSTNQAEKHGKIGAAYFKYESLDIQEYPPEVSQILNLICDWDKEEPVCVLEKA